MRGPGIAELCSVASRVASCIPTILSRSILPRTDSWSKWKRFNGARSRCGKLAASEARHVKLDPTSHPDATHSQASFGAHRSACAVAPSVGRLRQPNVARLACVRHAQRSAAGGPRLDARIVAHAPARLRTDGLDRLRHGLLELLGGGKGGCGSASPNRVRVWFGFGFGFGFG